MTPGEMEVQLQELRARVALLEVWTGRVSQRSADAWPPLPVPQYLPTGPLFDPTPFHDPVLE